MVDVSELESVRQILVAVRQISTHTNIPNIPHSLLPLTFTFTFDPLTVCLRQVRHTSQKLSLLGTMDVGDGVWDDVTRDIPSDTPGLEYFFVDDHRVVVLWLYTLHGSPPPKKTKGKGKGGSKAKSDGGKGGSGEASTPEWVSSVVARFAHALLLRHGHEANLVVHSVQGATLARVTHGVHGDSLSDAAHALETADLPGGLLPAGAFPQALGDARTTGLKKGGKKKTTPPKTTSSKTSTPKNGGAKSVLPNDVTFILVVKEIHSVDDIAHYLDVYKPHILHVSAFGESIPQTLINNPSSEKTIVRALFRDDNIRCCVFNVPSSKRITLLCSTGVHACVGTDSPHFVAKDGFVYFSTFLEYLVLSDASYVDAHFRANAAVVASYKSLQDHSRPRLKMIVALEMCWDQGKASVLPLDPNHHNYLHYTQNHHQAHGHGLTADGDHDNEPKPPAPIALSPHALDGDGDDGDPGTGSAKSLFPPLPASLSLESLTAADLAIVLEHAKRLGVDHHLQSLSQLNPFDLDAVVSPSHTSSLSGGSDGTLSDEGSSHHHHSRKPNNNLDAFGNEGGEGFDHDDDDDDDDGFFDDDDDDEDDDTNIGLEEGPPVSLTDVIRSAPPVLRPSDYVLRSSKIKASVVTQAPEAAASELAATDAASYHCIPTLPAYKANSVTRHDIESGPTDVDMDDDGSVNARLLAAALDADSLAAFDENDMSVRMLSHLCEADFDEYMQEKAVYIPDPIMYSSIVALALTDKQRAELLVTAHECLVLDNALIPPDTPLAHLIHIPDRLSLLGNPPPENNPEGSGVGEGALAEVEEQRLEAEDHVNVTTATTTQTLMAGSNAQNGGLVVHVGVPPSPSVGDTVEAVSALAKRASSIEVWAASNTAPSDLVIINWNSMRADYDGPDPITKVSAGEDPVSQAEALGSSSKHIPLFTEDISKADDLTQLFVMMSKTQVVSSDPDSDDLDPSPLSDGEGEEEAETTASSEKEEEETTTPGDLEVYTGPPLPAVLYVVGPPGCGKTAFLARFVLDAYRYLAASTTILHWFCDVRDLDSLEPYYFIHGISAQLVRSIPHLRDALHRVRKLLSPGNVARNPVKVFEKAVLAPLSAYFTQLALVSKHNSTLADDRLSTMVVLVIDGLDESLRLPERAPTRGTHTIHSILASIPESAFPSQFRIVLSSALDQETGEISALLPQPAFQPDALPSRFSGLCAPLNLDVNPGDVLQALLAHESSLEPEEENGGGMSPTLAAAAHMPHPASAPMLLKSPEMRDVFTALLEDRKDGEAPRLSLFQLHTLYYWCDPETDLAGLQSLIDDPTAEFNHWLVYQKALNLSLDSEAPLYSSVQRTREPALLALSLVLTSVQLLSPTVLLDAMDTLFPSIMEGSDRGQTLALLEGQLMPLFETQLDPLVDGEGEYVAEVGEGGKRSRVRVKVRTRVRRTEEEVLEELELDHGITEMDDEEGGEYQYQYEEEYQYEDEGEGGGSGGLGGGSGSGSGVGGGAAYMEENFLVPYTFRDPGLRMPTAQVRMIVSHAALQDWLLGQKELFADGLRMSHAILAVIWIRASFLSARYRISGGADVLEAKVNAFASKIRSGKEDESGEDGDAERGVRDATIAFVGRYSTYERFSLVAQHLARAEVGTPKERAALLSACVDVNVVTDKGNLSLFMEAAWRGDVVLVEFLLHLEDLDVNARNYDGASALHFAAGWGQAEVIDLLLHSELSREVIDVNSISRMGCSPLYMAAERNHVAAVKVLLTSGEIDVNLTGDMNTPLHVAAALGYVEVVSALVSHPAINLNSVGHMNCTPLLMASSPDVLDVILSARGVDVNCCDQDGITLLYFAAQRGDSGTVEKLLSLPGINVSPVELINRKTPLRVAADKGSADIVRMLLEVCDPEDVNAVAGDEFSILQSAAEYGHADVVAELVKIPALDVNATNAKDGLTALHFAAAKGHTGVVSALLDREDLDVNILNRHHCTALYTAAMHNHEAVVRDLLARGRDIAVNLPDNHLYTPCHIAVDKNNVDVVLTLLDDPECNVNAPAEMGLTPLHAAAYRGNDEVVKILLLAPELDVNAIDKEERTPLLVAAMHGKYKVCQLLVEDPRVDVNIADRHGYLPLHMAADKGRLRSVRALLSVPGVHVNAAAEQGVTPLHAASYENRCDVVSELLKYEGIQVNVAAAKDGATPLQIASDRGNLEVVELLLNAGAKDPRGKARKAAMIKGNLAIITLLDAKRCETCYVAEEGLKECTGCRSVVYCSRECQKRDWKAHKRACKAARK